MRKIDWETMQFSLGKLFFLTTIFAVIFTAFFSHDKRIQAAAIFFLVAALWLGLIELSGSRSSRSFLNGFAHGELHGFFRRLYSAGLHQ